MTESNIDFKLYHHWAPSPLGHVKQSHQKEQQLQEEQEQWLLLEEQELEG
jgi:hypothetical protein